MQKTGFFNFDATLKEKTFFKGFLNASVQKKIVPFN